MLECSQVIDMTMRYLLFICLFFALNQKAYSANPIIISTSQGYKQVTIHEDKNNSLALAQIMEIDREGKFKSPTDEILNLGNSKSSFWIKISYRNRTAQMAYLVVDVPNIDEIDFYAKGTTGKFVHQRSGSLAVTSPNVAATNHYVFELSPTGPNQQQGDVYLKVKSDNLMLLALKVADTKTLITLINNKTGFEAIYSGILIMLFIFNIFLFIGVKDKAYLYYSIYIVALFTYVVLYLRGYSYLLGTDFRLFINLYPHVFASISSIAIFFFSWEFLDVKKRVPELVNVYKLMIIAWVILLAIAIFFGKSFVAVWVNYLTFLSCLVASYSGLKAYRRGLKPALHFLLAWLAVGLSMMIALLGLGNIIPYYDFSYEIGPIGTTIEMLFFSFGLGDRYNQIHKEKTRIEKENFNLIISQNEVLEAVVEERTRKLMKTNAEKDKLFSIVAHDLRSPFNSLISILELHDKELLDFEELKMMLAASKKNIDQIRLTLDNLLYWAKGQMERASSNPEILDMQALIEQLILVYQPLSTSKSLDLVVHVDGASIVFADGNEINLILRNLIDNALKFSPPHMVIRIKVEEHLHKVQISVCNAIEQNNTHMGRLLDPTQFMSTPGTNNGVGLGLHLCREYIKSNGGEIQFDIKDGEVIISFSLPKPTQAQY
jgi:signal transduction histidine kinase